MSDRFSRFTYHPTEPSERVTGCAEHRALSRKIAREGIVLLKNVKNALPLKKDETTALFGRQSYDYIKGGGGSGDVYCPVVYGIYDGLSGIEKNRAVRLYEPLFKLYNGEKDPAITEDIVKKAASECETAIVTIGRFSEENSDRKAEKGDYFLTDDEAQLIENVSNAFSKTVVVLNIGGVIDSSWFKNNQKISAVLLSWQAGCEAGKAIAGILCGDCPCGRLTDTFAESFTDYPSSAGFSESIEYVNYTEDIYVGYRYFLTLPGMNEKIVYPFGYGLSYTNFEISGVTTECDGKKITISADIKNAGKCAGKEVVQLYYSAPFGKLGKPSRCLTAFAKTKELSAGETQKITLSFAVNDMASFDDTGKIQKSAFVLEKGVYKFYLGGNSLDASKTEFEYTVFEDTVVKKSTSLCAPRDLKKRLMANGKYEELPVGAIQQNYPVIPEVKCSKPSQLMMFDEVTDDRSLDVFMTQLTDDELIMLAGGRDNTGVSNTACFGGLPRLNIPSVPTADGPAGLRLEEKYGIPATAWPCATLLACTWEPSLAYEMGAAAASELLENAIGIWLAPALNIHRNPLCGRNFEYFSEDPLISGKMAAAEVGGIQSKNISACIKHFCCNNKEEGRFGSDSRVSERALREIYLKGFEICVTENEPMVIMTSYNRINGCFTNESDDLIRQILRGEWGYGGMVTTDWGVIGSHPNKVRAGNDIRMPDGKTEELRAALDSGEITRGELADCVKRMLQTILRLG